MRFWIFALASLASSLCFAASDTELEKSNAALNLTYTQFTKAFSTLDPSLVQAIYAENACYIPEAQGKEITQGRENIVALYTAFFGKIRHKKARIEVDFRVIERQIEGKSATDIGYYLVRFHPPQETEEPVSEFAGKFVTVSKQKVDGKWYLTVDTNNRAESSFYFDAKPTPNLYYGRQFSPLKNIEND